MAEIIQDIYSLKFDSAQFQTQLQSAIDKVEELQSAMEDASDSGEQLEGAQESLASALGDLDTVLKKDVKSVDDLNSKQRVLSQTQKVLSKDSKALASVTKETVKTQDNLAVATASATKNSKSLGGSVLDGAKKLNSLKRAAGLVSGAFRLLGSFNPIGLAITGLTLGIALLGQFFTATDKAKTGLEKLNDPSLSLNERQLILEQELESLNNLESRRGALTEEEKKQRDDLTAKYKETSDEILRIEQERIERITGFLRDAEKIRIKLLGDTAEAARATARLETSELRDETGKRSDALIKETNELATQRQKLLDEGQVDLARDLQIRINSIEKEIEASNKIADAKLAQIQLEQQLKLVEKARAIEAEKRKLKEQEVRDLVDKDREAAENDALFYARIAQEQADFEKKTADELAAYKKTVNIQSVADEVKAANDAGQQVSEISQRITERQLQEDILALEISRNKELLIVRQTIADKEDAAKKIEEIDKEFSRKRVKLEALATVEIARNRIKVLEDAIAKSASLGLDTTTAQKEIADLKLRIQELENAALVEIDVDTDNAKGKIEGLGKEILDGFSNVGNAVFDLLSQQAAFLTEKIDAAVQKSKSALDSIRNNSEDFNADQLALEKERLLQLENARRRSALREVLIAQIQVAANSAIAISKAAAEGGVAAPFTIATTIVALIAGFAAAANAASGAFFTGTEYLERGNAPKGRDTIHVRAHEGERIIPTANNLNYWDAYSAMQNEVIPANVANLFAKGYASGGLKNAIKSVSSFSKIKSNQDVNMAAILGTNALFFVNKEQNFTGLQNDIEELKEEVKRLPERMPVATFNVNSHGLYMSTKRYTNKDEIRKNRAK